MNDLLRVSNYFTDCPTAPVQTEPTILTHPTVKAGGLGDRYMVLAYKEGSTSCVYDGGQENFNVVMPAGLGTNTNIERLLKAATGCRWLVMSKQITGDRF